MQRRTHACAQGRRRPGDRHGCKVQAHRRRGRSTDRRRLLRRRLPGQDRSAARRGRGAQTTQAHRGGCRRASGGGGVDERQGDAGRARVMRRLSRIVPRDTRRIVPQQQRRYRREGRPVAGVEVRGRSHARAVHGATRLPRRHRQEPPRHQPSVEGRSRGGTRGDASSHATAVQEPRVGAPRRPRPPRHQAPQPRPHR